MKFKGAFAKDIRMTPLSNTGEGVGKTGLGWSKRDVIFDDFNF